MSSSAVRPYPIDISNYIVFNGIVSNQRVRVYLNNSTDAYYVNTSFTTKLKTTKLRSPLPVEYANSSRSQPITEWTSIKLALRGYTEELPYFITKLEYDVVLGRPQLRAYNPTIDQVKGTITFSSNNCLAYRLRETGFAEVRYDTSNRATKLAIYASSISTSQAYDNILNGAKGYFVQESLDAATNY